MSNASGAVPGSAPRSFAHEDAGYQQGLKSRHIQMIALGGAIGTGLFLGSAERLHVAGPSLAIVYLVAGVVAFFVIRAMGEMVMHRPSTGSFVSYSREFMGERAAYFAGWMYFLNWATSGIADVTAAALYVRYFFPTFPQWISASVALGVVLTVNLVSVRVFGELEFWFSAIKVVTILAFLAIGIGVLVSRHQVDGNVTGPQLISQHGGFFPLGVLVTLTILQGVVFAYSGIEMVGVTAGEAEDPRKAVPKAINSIGYRIVVFYIGSILLLVMLLPYSAYTPGVSPFVTFLSKLGVPGAGAVMDLVVLTAALSSVNSGLYSTGRILRSMSAAGSAPRFTGRMSRSGVPYGGILLTATIYLFGIVLNLFVPFEAFEIALQFSALGIIAMWSMIMVCHLAMYRRTKLGELPRPAFRLPFAPYTNYATLAFLLGVLVLTYFNGLPGKIIIYSLPVLAAILVAGWLAVRRRVARIAAGQR